MSLKMLQNKTIHNVIQGSNATHVIPVDYRELNESFIGTITVKYPSQIDKLAIGVTRTTLLGGLRSDQVDVHTDNLSLIFATLDNVIVNKPDWFDINSPMISYEMLEDVYLKYNDWVNAFQFNGRRDTTTTEQ